MSEGQNNLPLGWATAPLANVADSCLGKMLDKAKHTTGIKLPYLRNINVRWGGFDLSDLYEMYFEEDQLERYGVKLDDVLVCEGGEPGRAAVWRENDTEVKFQKALHRVRPSRALLPDWLVHSLKHDAEAGRLSEYFTGTTIKHLTGRSLARYELRLPPLDEQKRIVAKIEALQEEADAAKEALDAIPPLLERFRQSVLASAFRGDLTKAWREKHPDVEPTDAAVARTPTPLRPTRYKSRSKTVQPGVAALAVGNPGTATPPGWKWVPLVDVARLESGHTPSRRHPEWWGGDVHWIGIPDAREHHGRTITETKQQTNEDGLANSAARLLPAGTVCLSRTASVGYVVVMGREMATSQDFVNWTCTDAVEPQWLKYLFMAEERALWRFAKGSTHSTIYYPEVLSFHVCLPPVEEQRAIVRAVEERLDFADLVETAVESATEAWANIGQSILAKAFRGDLVPQDPDDEPASVLLERIRAEREAAGGKGKGSRVAKSRAGSSGVEHG